MDTYITHTTTGTCLLRIQAPCRLFVVDIAFAGGQPTLTVLHNNLSNFAQLAIGNTVPSLLHHRVAKIRMGEPIKLAAGFGTVD